MSLFPRRQFLTSIIGALMVPFTWRKPKKRDPVLAAYFKPRASTFSLDVERDMETLKGLTGTFDCHIPDHLWVQMVGWSLDKTFDVAEGKTKYGFTIEFSARETIPPGAVIKTHSPIWCDILCRRPETKINPGRRPWKRPDQTATHGPIRYRQYKPRVVVSPDGSVDTVVDVVEDVSFVRDLPVRR